MPPSTLLENPPPGPLPGQPTSQRPAATALPRAPRPRAGSDAGGAGRARRAVPAPITPRAFSCRCGRPVFFNNSECLACGSALGYAPERRELLALEPAPRSAGLCRAAGRGRAAARWARCANLHTAAACNWLLPEAELRPAAAPGAAHGPAPSPGPAEAGAGPAAATPLPGPPADACVSPPASSGAGALCRCCRLTRTLPDLSQPDNATFWNRIEQAKRRLVSSLLALGLPVASKAEDAAGGLAFDLLRAPPGGPAVVTGHADGVITLDVEEACDARREQRRTSLAEPYRTLLGHLRHETGHHYWQRLVEPDARRLAEFRALFGDERADYAAALQRHYAQGPPADWGQRFVSAYASSHPWEDWAETWAHYLHLVDTLDTARSFGLDGERVELRYERFGPEAIAPESPPPAPPGDGSPDGASSPPPGAPTGAAAGAAGPENGADFLQLLNGWMELTGVLNELSRSMGVPDFYPFVLSRTAVRKLHAVHRVVHAAAGAAPGARAA